MPSSISNFCALVNAATPASGARYLATQNADGSVTVTRQASANAPFAAYAPRIIYNVGYDTIFVGDGSIQAASPAQAWINSLS
jgi:hypothetical protein